MHLVLERTNIFLTLNSCVFLDTEEQNKKYLTPYLKQSLCLMVYETNFRMQRNVHLDFSLFVCLAKLVTPFFAC